MPDSAIHASGRTAADPAYRTALLDWLACACAGADQRAALAVAASAEGVLGDVAFAGAAGHVLDFDDTFSDGVAHVSAACAPAALALAAHLGLSIGTALDAYADGFEAMAALAEASHPALYNGGWHPTAVCGSVGAAVVASQLLELSAAERDNALALAALRAAGMRGAFGSDGKAIQVGLAAAAGVQAAMLAQAGACIDRRAIDGPLGFEAVFGATWPELDRRPRAATRAIDRNWIKPYPSCLGTHAAIAAAELSRERGFRFGEEPVEVMVDPVARQAAHLDLVDDGLSAKFSIQYCVAHTLSHGPPRVSDFETIDPPVKERSSGVTVTVDESLPRFAAAFKSAGRELARVSAPPGAPENPMSAAQLAAKIADLAGERLDGVLDDLDAPATAAIEAAALSPSLRAVRHP